MFSCISGSSGTVHKEAPLMKFEWVVGRGRLYPHRDPLVKAWILQNTNGICERCGKEGPFIDKSILKHNLFLCL